MNLAVERRQPHRARRADLDRQLARGPRGAASGSATTAPGSPSEEQRLIFERFASSPSVRGSSGAGLGLAIVKAIAEAHGGRVELDSARRRRGAVHNRPPSAMTRILIAEDEDRLASFLEKGLRSSGYTTTVVPDGPRAATMARDEEFDLLILDLGLPGKDGLSVLRELRRDGQRLPVIILTARDDPADKVAGLEAGADDYLAKPFHFEELLARVRARLRGDQGEEDRALRVGDVSLDLRTRWATVGRRDDRALRPRVRAAAHLPPAPQPGAHPRAAALPRLGLRLRPRLERRRRLRRLPPPQARSPPLRDGARRRLPLPLVASRPVARGRAR